MKTLLSLTLTLAVYISLLVPYARAAEDKTDAAFKDRVAAASHILVGKVRSLASRLVDKKIFTVAQVEPLEILKGSTEAHKPIEVVFRGGRVGNVDQEVSHEPRLQQGEVVLLYLRAASPKALVPGLNVVDGDGVVGLLTPDQPESRLKNNRRLRAWLDSEAERVKKAGQK